MLTQTDVQSEEPNFLKLGYFLKSRIGEISVTTMYESHDYQSTNTSSHETLPSCMILKSTKFAKRQANF